MDWDDLEPVSDTAGSQSDTTPAPQQNPAPDWDNMEPVHAQAPNWDDLHPVDQTQPAPDTALTTFAKSAARAAIPVNLGGLAGLGAAGAASESGPGAFVAGVAAGGATTFAAQKAQDAITDALGITDPAQEAANLQAHPRAAEIGEFAAALPTFGVGKLSTALATRLLSGGIMGGLNVAQQAATTGEVDPTEALIATGAGAVLAGNPRAWATDASDALASRLGGALKGRSGTQVNPNADVSTPAEQMEVTNTPVQTSPSEATAYEQGRTPNTLSDQTENPAAGMDAKAGGFSAGVGDLSRDQGKGSPQKGEGIPGAPSTTIDGITPGIGGQDAAAALKAEQPEPLANNGPLTGSQEQPRAVNGPSSASRAEPTPVVPPEGQNGVKNTPQPLQTATEPPADMAGLQDRRANTPALEPYTGNERRGVPGATNPDEGILEASRLQREAAAKAQDNVKKGQLGEDFDQDTVSTPQPEVKPSSGNDIPAKDVVDNGIPDFLKRTPPPVMQAMSRFNMPKNLNEATDNLLKYLGKKIGSQPEATQSAINAGAAASGRAPPITRNAVESFLATTPLAKVFNPANVSEASRAAAASIRSEVGQAARIREQFFDSVEPLRAVLNKLPDDVKTDFQIAMQTDKPVSSYLPELQPLANAMKTMFKGAEQRIVKANLLDPEDFYQNFFPQKWKSEADAKKFVADFFAKQGSGSSLKQRTFPTIADGLAAGLKLKSTDPIEVGTRYLNQIDHFMAANEVLKNALRDGYASTERGPGLIKLEGRGIGRSPIYGTEDFARVFNNFYSPGFHQTLEGGRIYDVLRHASNSITGLELGMSLYHPFTIAKEAFISKAALGVSKVISGLKSGDFEGATKGLADIAKSPAAPYSYFKQGQAFAKEYLHPGTMGPELQKVVNAFTGANGRAIGMTHDPTYEFSGLGSLWTAYRRGALGLQLADARRNITAPFTNATTAAGLAKATLKAGANTGNELFRGVGRVMQTVAQPLFEHYIPAVKNGAFGDMMSSWLAKNPLASDHEQAFAARRFVDSIDNRFGEMVQDNLMWNKYMRQTAMAGMRSYSWFLGTVREIAGGASSAVMHPGRLDIGSKDYDPRAAYAITMPLVVGVMSAAYQFLKTGKPPADQYDLMAGRTGGQLKNGKPERAVLPGYEKDVYGWLHNPTQEAVNKIATAPRLVAETAFNRDWRGDPIANEQSPLTTRLGQYFMHVVNSMVPISFKTVAQQGKAGSNISRPESATAIRPAPSWINPGGNPAEQKAQEKAWKLKLAHDKAS